MLLGYLFLIKNMFEIIFLFTGCNFGYRYLWSISTTYVRCSRQTSSPIWFWMVACSMFFYTFISKISLTVFKQVTITVTELYNLFLMVGLI